MSSSTDRVRRHRQRAKTGEIIVTTKVSPAEVQTLVRCGALGDREHVDGREIGDALVKFVRMHGNEKM